MVIVPFPGSGVPQKKSIKLTTLTRKSQPVEEGVRLDIQISEGGVFFHDFSDIFIPGLPTGYFAEDPLTNTPSEIISSPARGVGKTMKLFFLDLENNHLYVQPLNVVASTAKKTSKPKKK